MMTRRFILTRALPCTAAASVLATPVLAAKKVMVYVGPEADFARYKTYEWLPTKILAKSGVVENDPEFGPIIKAAVNKQLVLRGLTEVASGGDLQVNTLALSESVPQLEAVIFPGNVNLMYESPIATMGRYNKEGTLVVNLIDTRTKKSAWAALAKETLKTTPGSNKGKIEPVTIRLFEKYPVKPNKK